MHVSILINCAHSMSKFTKLYSHLNEYTKKEMITLPFNLHLFEDTE